MEPVKWPPIRWYSKPAGSPVCTRYGRPGDVDDGLHERLVERHERVAVAGDAALVAERLPDGLAEHDADVFDGVVHVDLDVALARTVRSASECFANAVSRWS